MKLMLTQLSTKLELKLKLKLSLAKTGEGYSYHIQAGGELYQAKLTSYSLLSREEDG